MRRGEDLVRALARSRDRWVGPVFSALSDSGRRYVVEALAERGDATATELAAELPVTRQAVTSTPSTRPGSSRRRARGASGATT